MAKLFDDGGPGGERYPEVRPLPPGALGTGHPELDDAIGGLGRGELVLAVGRRGTGVTTLLLGVAHYVAGASGLSVAVVAPSSTSSRLEARFLRLATGSRDPAPARAAEAVERLRAAPISIVQPGKGTVLEAVGRHDLVVVDDVDAFGHFAWELRLAARETRSAVLTGIAHVEPQHGGTLPQAAPRHHFVDAADVVLALRPSRAEPGIVSLDVAWHRHAPAGARIQLARLWEVGRLANLARPA